MAVEHASNGVYWSIENLWCRGVSYQKSVAVNCLSIARSIRSVVWISVRGLSWVMLFQFAPCFGVKRSFETKIGYEHFLWHTFDETGRIKWNSEMGLLLLGISWSLCTSASFHVSGNILVVKEVLMMDMIVGRIEGKTILNYSYHYIRILTRLSMTVLSNFDPFLKTISHPKSLGVFFRIWHCTLTNDCFC